MSQAYFIISFRSDFHLKHDFVQKLGIYDLSEFSAKPDSFEQNIDVVFIVITRWTAKDNRDVMRNTFGKVIKSKSETFVYNYKLMFLFSLPNNPKVCFKQLLLI